MVDGVRGLASFPTRPPTPPRERNDTVTELAHDNHAYFNSIIQQAVLDTPDDSPSSSGEYFGRSLDKGSKRVVFSPWPKYHKPFSLGSKNAVLDGNIRPLPPSRDCQSSKSILKRYIETAITPDTKDTKEPLAVDPSDTPAMLRSTIQHLASASRSSRLDAYMTILGCLSAYDDVPDAPALAERLLELTEFIRRDVSARMEATGAPDTQLATQALKLLTTLLCTGKLGDSIPEEFSSFITDRAISVLEDSEMPKIIVGHHMQLLAKQNFSSKVMSNDRASRLLSALGKVADHVNGNRVVGHRLMIYQRLLTQTKPLMKLRVGEWMDHLIAGMLNSLKEIRCRAITFGLEAGLALGTTSTVSQACIDIFNRVSPEGRKLMDLLTSRLNEMLASKEDGIHAPQICSVAILFLRSRRRQIERWEHLKTWLQIIQRCFNSSDAHVKVQTNLAWNRLVFAVNPDISTSSSMVKMLRQPLVSQLNRNTNDKHSKHGKHIARSSYCNLLYYTFRPVPTQTQIDQYWEEYVSQIIPGSFSASKSDMNHACEILAALFKSTAPKVWDENRANTGVPIKPEDLPCLDPKWIRQRAATILTTFDKMLDATDWQLDTAEEAPIVLAWRNFTAAVGEAGTKEVKVSMESLTAVAQILTTIKRLWERNLRQQEAAEDRDVLQTIQRVSLLIHEAVTNIGSMPFTERRLVQSSRDTFEAAETPSTRSGRHQGPLNSPILHLLHMVSSGVGDGPVSQAYQDLVGSLVHIALQSATFRRSKLGVLRDMARLISTEGEPQAPAKLSLWRFIAEATRSAITVPMSTDNHNDSPQYAGHDYREAVKILEVGLQLNAVENLDAWLSLSNAIIDLLRHEVGDGGVILIFTEPLAHAVIQNGRYACNDFRLNCAIAILNTVSWPQSRQVMERVHKILWGTIPTSHKAQPLDPFDNLYMMVNNLLSDMYQQLESEASATMVPFLTAVTSIISLCPLSLKAILLKRIQQGLALWVEDAKGLMNHSRSDPKLDGLYTEAKKLWSAVAVAVKAVPKSDNALLTSIQDLIVSSLTSRHQAVMNESIGLWNCTFGNAEFLEYRDDLRIALSKLKSVTEMKLPNFPEDDMEVMSSLIRFIDSQDDIDNLPDTLVSGFGKRTAMMRDTTPRPLIGSLTRLSASSPKSSSRRSAEKKTTPTARLRHNDSQVQFAAVESSSPLAPYADDSQLLTERQKEVKERQRREAAAIFPDIGSSPMSRSRTRDKRSPPKLVLSGSQRSHANLDADDSSPVLPSDDVLMKDVLGSSPTPRSNRRVTLDLGSDFEPPSSPPTAPAVVAAVEQLAPPLIPSRIMQDQLKSVNPEENNPGAEPENEDVRLPRGEPVSVQHFEEVTVGKQPETVIHNTNPKLEGKTSNEDDRIRSDTLPCSGTDMFVDAPSEPVGETPATESSAKSCLVEPASFSSNPPLTSYAHEEPGSFKTVQQVATPMASSDAPTKAQGHAPPSTEATISSIMDSFNDESTSFYSNDDEQIAAQLVNDLERASQQASPQKDQRSGASSQFRRGRKRKMESGSLRRNSKKAKAAQGIEVVVETRQPGDNNDCVIVDNRRAVSNLSPWSPEIKQERSQSPSEDIAAVTKAVNVKTTPVRRTRSSTGGAPTTENLLPRSRRRKAGAHSVKTEDDGDAGDIVAPPLRKRRSARLSQASMDSARSQDISSAENYKDCAEVSDHKLSAEHNSSDGTSQGRSESPRRSKSQTNSLNPEHNGNHHAHEHEGAPPPVATLVNEALPRAFRQRPRPLKPQEAEFPQAAGSAGNSLDEGEHDPKRQARDTARHLKEPDAVMQQDEDPEAPHAARSSAQRLLASLRQWIGDIQRAVLEPEEEREVVSLMFESIHEVHEAGRRNTGV